MMERTEMKPTSLILSALLTLSAPVLAADLPRCTATPSDRPDARPHPDKIAVTALAMELEARGEAAFHLAPMLAQAECEFGRDGEGGASRIVSYSPLVRGKHLLDRHALIYRVRQQGDGAARELVIGFSALASILYLKGQDTYYAAEERDGRISWYAVYDSEPSGTQVRTLAEAVFSGMLKPKLALHWPKGAREAEAVEMNP